MKIIIGILVILIFQFLIINVKWVYSLYKFLNPFLITLISTYLTIRLPIPFDKIFPSTYHSQLNLGAYALVLSAVKMGIDKIYELNQSKITLSFSKEEYVFYDEETVYIKFNNDVSKVFVKIIFDGKISYLTSVDNIKIKLPIQVTAQKIKKYEHLYDLEDKNKSIVIHVKNILSIHKKNVESDEITLGFDVIKSSDVVNSKIESTVQYNNLIKKPDFKFNNVKFTK